mmetsp:Transcript_53401/g.141571  ORF Transcript_53401/g.141571 Transcript_53401/m.141571 type:complete len:346 (+) Transcript_53401:122-1159(+)
MVAVLEIKSFSASDSFNLHCTHQQFAILVSKIKALLLTIKAIIRTTGRIIVGETWARLVKFVPFVNSLLQRIGGVIAQSQRRSQEPDLDLMSDSCVSDSVVDLEPQIMSLDYVLPDGQPEHFSRHILCSMRHNSLGHLMSCPSFLESLRRVFALRTRVNQLGRNGKDLAGKVPLHLLLTSVGITNILIDNSQAGGLYGTADGFAACARPWFLEIKGSSRKARGGVARGPNARDQYQFCDIRFAGTSWRHLFLVCRPREPSDWTQLSECKRCGFILGHVSRERYAEALRRGGRSEQETHSVAVTPFSSDNRNWLGEYISWVTFDEFSAEWWRSHVESGPQSASPAR